MPRKLDWNSRFRQSSDVAGRDWKRLAPRVVSGRRQRGYKTTRQFAEALGISERTIGKLERGQSVSASTLADVETELGWAPGSMDDILDRQGEATLRTGPAAGNDEESRARTDGAALPFDVAFDEYRKSLRRLRLAAEADPDVDPEATALIEDLTLIAHAMMYGGARGGRQAIRDVAEGDKREALSENDSHRTA